MSEFVEHITDARNNGTINVYAVRYNQRDKTDNVAVALPGNLDFDFRHDFCENIIQYEEAQEVAFNPTSNGLEDGTYEYIPLSNVREKWDVFANLLDNSLDYHGAENRKKVNPEHIRAHLSGVGVQNFEAEIENGAMILNRLQTECSKPHSVT